MKCDCIKRYLITFDATEIQMVMTGFPLCPFEGNLILPSIMPKRIRNSNALHVWNAFLNCTFFASSVTIFRRCPFFPFSEVLKTLLGLLQKRLSGNMVSCLYHCTCGQQILFEVECFVWQVKGIHNFSRYKTWLYNFNSMI